MREHSEALDAAFAHLKEEVRLAKAQGDDLNVARIAKLLGNTQNAGGQQSAIEGAIDSQFRHYPRLRDTFKACTALIYHIPDIEAGALEEYRQSVTSRVRDAANVIEVADGRIHPEELMDLKTAFNAYEAYLAQTYEMIAMLPYGNEPQALSHAEAEVQERIAASRRQGTDLLRFASEEVHRRGGGRDTERQLMAEMNMIWQGLSEMVCVETLDGLRKAMDSQQAVLHYKADVTAGLRLYHSDISRAGHQLHRAQGTLMGLFESGVSTPFPLRHYEVLSALRDMRHGDNSAIQQMVPHMQHPEMLDANLLMYRMYHETQRARFSWNSEGELRSGAMLGRLKGMCDEAHHISHSIPEEVGAGVRLSALATVAQCAGYSACCTSTTRKRLETQTRLWDQKFYEAQEAAEQFVHALSMTPSDCLRVTDRNRSAAHANLDVQFDDVITGLMDGMSYFEIAVGQEQKKRGDRRTETQQYYQRAHRSLCLLGEVLGRRSAVCSSEELNLFEQSERTTRDFLESAGMEVPARPMTAGDLQVALIENLRRIEAKIAELGPLALMPPPHFSPEEQVRREGVREQLLADIKQEEQQRKAEEKAAVARLERCLKRQRERYHHEETPQEDPERERHQEVQERLAHIRSCFERGEVQKFREMLGRLSPSQCRDGGDQYQELNQMVSAIHPDGTLHVEELGRGQCRIVEEAAYLEAGRILGDRGRIAQQYAAAHSRYETLQHYAEQTGNEELAAKATLGLASCCHLEALPGLKEAMHKPMELSGRTRLLSQALRHANEALSRTCDLLGIEVDELAHREEEQVPASPKMQRLEQLAKASQIEVEHIERVIQHTGDVLDRREALSFARREHVMQKMGDRWFNNPKVKERGELSQKAQEHANTRACAQQMRSFRQQEVPPLIQEHERIVYCLPQSAQTRRIAQPSPPSSDTPSPQSVTSASSAASVPLRILQRPVPDRQERQEAWQEVRELSPVPAAMVDEQPFSREAVMGDWSSRLAAETYCDKSNPAMDKAHVLKYWMQEPGHGWASDYRRNLSYLEAVSERDERSGCWTIG